MNCDQVLDPSRAGRLAVLLPVVVLAVSPALADGPAQSIPHLSNTSRNFSSADQGTCHVVKRGQTLFSISQAYKVPLEVVVEANGIPDPSLVPAGRVLFIPGATRPLEISAPAATPVLHWPLHGMVTSAFGPESGREHHEGIDIDGILGQTVRAAAAGRVIWVGTERGYGNLVILDHGHGLSTLYAHASRLLVGPDEWVDSGEPVAEVGDTGNARGAHLHFEVHRNGQPVDPLSFLGGGIVRVSSGR